MEGKLLELERKQLNTSETVEQLFHQFGENGLPELKDNITSNWSRKMKDWPNLR